MRRVDDLAEKLMPALAGAVGAGVVFGMAAATFYPVLEGVVLGRFTLAQLRHAPKAEIFLAGACFMLGCLLWSLREIIVVWRLEDQMRTWRFGMRGEQAVAEALTDRSLAAAGYVAFHDLPGDGKWNIDHVVVGPAGVFVLETKARPRRKATPVHPEVVADFAGLPWIGGVMQGRGNRNSVARAPD
jgi:hypothetical protein